MNHQTVAARVATARKLYGDAVPGLMVDAPLDRPPDPLAVLRQPVNQREWLTRAEAAEFLGCDPFSIRNWLAAGLLPNTQRPNGKKHLFLRADLQRIRNAPRYRGHGVDYRALRAQIEASPV